MAIQNISKLRARQEITEFEKNNWSKHGRLEIVTCWNEADPDFVQYRFFDKSDQAVKVTGISRMEEPDEPGE